MSDSGLIFNPPPGWPKPPPNWRPPKGWTPDPSWLAPPDGWQLWLPQENQLSATPEAGEADGTEVTSSAEVEIGGEVSRIAFLQAEIAALKAQLQAVQSAEDIAVFNDEWVLQEAGIYRYHHPLENAATYQVRLGDLGARIADMVKSGRAIEQSETFTFDNSLAKGRKMAGDLAKLMLRAYNAEADNSIRALRAGNAQAAKKRLERSREAIARYGGLMQMHISDAYHSLRLEEVELTADYLVKKQEEREAAREETARLREERRVAQELAAERERLDKERAHILNAIEALRGIGSQNPELERKLVEIDEAIAQNDFRSANIRAGYIYVISNRGAFGDGVVKIGLTRRLQPMERVTELGGASVPFRFDTHALFFSEDAVSLEADLHAHFVDRRVNMVNERKEFFFATAAEVREVLLSKLGDLLEFSEKAEATEFLQSRRYWPRGSFSRPTGTGD
jgi:uncharacterized small protein (DUF1192 family)